MCKKSNATLFCGLILVLFGLVAALIPLFDLDQDGCLETLVTEGYLLPPVLNFSIGLLTLFTRIPTDHILTSQNSNTPLIPPPISNK